MRDDPTRDDPLGCQISENPRTLELHPPLGQRAREDAASGVARSAARIRLARGIAVVADTVQIAFIPLFGPGFLSPFDDALDVAIGLVMVWLVGWHFAFLPTVVAELVPGLDLFPSWTAAVWFATRKHTPATR